MMNEQDESGEGMMHDMDFDLCEFADRLTVHMEPELAKRKQRIKLDVSAVHRSQVVGDESVLAKVFTGILACVSKAVTAGREITFSIRELPKLRTGYIHYCFSVGDFTVLSDYDDMSALVDMLSGDIEMTGKPGQACRLTVTLGLKIRE